MKRGCFVCGTQYTVALSIKDPDFEKNRERWRNGALVQDVWPHATPTEREQLITGICSDDCWRDIFAESERD